jgi:predicted nucleotidyltransferase
MATELGTTTREAVQKRYEAAVDVFVERVRQDTHILAAILFGSLSYDEVWEQSDIDMWLIARDESSKPGAT